MSMGTIDPSKFGRGLCAAAALVLALALQAPYAIAEGEGVEEAAATEQTSDASIEVVQDAAEPTDEASNEQDGSQQGEGDAAQTNEQSQVDGLLPAVDTISLTETHYADDDLIETFYMDENGETHTVKALPITQANASRFLFSHNGWCVVTEDILVKHRFEAFHDNIIIADGVTATIDGGIEVGDHRSLDIYGQSEFGGTLICHGSGANSCPGIGGTYQYGNNGGTYHSFGEINFHSGTVIADGPTETAGIGGGRGCTNNGTINIYGGDITATGGGDDRYGTPGGAAGIGGSKYGDCGTINIYGGKVTATGSHGGAGIGCGYLGKGGSVEIHGGTVNATGGDAGSCDAYGGAGIGCGSNRIYHDDAIDVDMSILIDGGTVEATGRDGGAGIGGGFNCSVKSIDILGGNVNARGLRGIGWNEVYAAGIGGGQLGKNTQITLGYTKESDTICANYFEGHVSVVADQALTNDEHSGVIFGENVDPKMLGKLNGKTMRKAKLCTVTYEYDEDTEPKSEQHYEGEVIRLPEKPDLHRDDIVNIRGWYVGDKEMWENQVFTLTDNVIIKASIVYDGYWLTIDRRQASLVQPSNYKPHRGEKVTLTTTLPWGKRLKGGVPSVKANDGSTTVEVSKTDDLNVYTFKMIDKDVNVSVELEDIPDATPTFGMTRINKDGSLGLMATVNLSRDKELDWSDSYMEYKIDGKAARTVKVPIDQAITRNSDKPGFDAYDFNFPISSIEMAQNVTATFHYGDGRTIERGGLSMENSIKNIVDGFYNRGEGDATEVAFAQSLANYGHYAQRFFAAVNGQKSMSGYNPIETRYTKEDNFAKDEALDAVIGHKVRDNIGNSAINKMTCSLELGSEITLNLTLYVPEGTQLEGEAYFQGNTFRFDKISPTSYRVRITGIRAYDLNRIIPIVGEAGGDFEIHMSVLAYLNAILTKNAYGAEGDYMACSLLQYYYTAKNFHNEDVQQ